MRWNPMRTSYSRLAVVLMLGVAACARATTTTTTAAAPTATTTSSTTTTTTTSTSTSAAQAQSPATAGLPAARTLIDRYVQAIGGRDAVLRHSTIRYVGTFEVPAAGVKGDLSVVQAAPNKTAVTMTMPGMGQMLQGYDGSVGWSVNPMQGPRVLEGKELEQLREEDRKSTRLNSSHANISYAVFCLKK